MVEFICESCGNRQVTDQRGNTLSRVKALDVHGKYTCSQCGAEVTKEQLNALIVAAAKEATAVSKLCQQARSAYKQGDYQGATDIYQQVMATDPENWEAEFYSVCSNSRMSVGVSAENGCNAVRLCLETVFDKIDLLQGQQKENAVKLVTSDACIFALNSFDAAVKQHAALVDVSAMSRHNTALRNQLTSAINIAITCADQVMKRYSGEERLAALVEAPAKCAIEMQSRQSYVTVVLEPETSKTLLGWIGRFNPEYVEAYQKKQNRSVASGTIFLMVLGAIFLVLGLVLEGVFAKWFCIPMAVFCLGMGIIRIIVQAANNSRKD